VILPPGFEHPLLDDSKKLSASKREVMRGLIEASALCWAVSSVGPEEIDRINILNASILAMHQALDQLQVRPRFLLIDGNRFRDYPGIPHECIIRGDAIYASIAAASILAKTHRDQYMADMEKNFPGYGWTTNKGYPTVSHCEALLRLGPSPIHRRSFTVSRQLRLFPGRGRN
jgi:ribonuclease HII